MGEYRPLIVFLCILPCFKLSSGGPLITPNGSLDSHGVEQHILQLEQTVADLTAQFQTQEQKQAAVISSLLSKFASTSNEFSNLKLNFDKLGAKYNSSLIELSTTKAQLTTNLQDITALRKDYDSTRVELAATKGDLNATSQDLLLANAEIVDLRKKNDATFLELAAVKGHLNSTEITNTQNMNILQILQRNVTFAVSQLSIQKDLLNTTSEKLQKVIKDAASTVTAQQHLQELIMTTKSDVLTVNQTVTSFEKSMSSLSTKFNGIIANEQTVAFSCALTHDRTVKDQQVIKYDNVILNIGNGFSMGTGIFICPRGGIYIFYFHAFTSSGKKATLQLVHNGVVVARASGHGTTHGNDGDGNSAFVQAKTGDKIWVKSSDESMLHGSGNHLYNSFSGFRVGH